MDLHLLFLLKKLFHGKCPTIMSYNILVEIIINIVHSLAINDEL